MEPRDAIKVLADATRKIKAKREKHQLWVEAVNVLLRVIEPRPKLPDPKETTVG